MPQRSMTNETARCPICRYGVCPRSHSASIIEFSKCVRRHQVTKLLGFPSQPFRFRKGVTASSNPFCISTMVPYWSNVSTLTSRLRTSSVSVMLRSARVKVRIAGYRIGKEFCSGSIAADAVRELQRRMSGAPRKRQSATKMLPIVKGPGCVERGRYEGHC